MNREAAERSRAWWVRRGFLALVVALALFRVDLTFGIPSELRYLSVDDLHFQRQAEHLAEGRWLGPYDECTLIKGPGYPMYLAAAHHAGLPRRTAEDLLRVFAALVLLFSLRRLGLPRSLALLAFAGALFSLDGFRSVMQRPVREYVYASQTLLIFALGVATLAPGRFRVRLVFALALGLCGAWFHLTREEGPWILPAMGVLGVGLAVLDHARGRSWRGSLASAGVLAAVPLIVISSATAGLRHQNERHYGAPVISEFKDSEFTEALAALRRVTLADWCRFEPLNSAEREALYAASPAFAEMSGAIESRRYTAPVMLAENGERMFAFLTWLIRDAAREHGHHASLAESRAFYRRLADEVNAACDAGRVPAVEPVGSSHPGPHREGWRLLIESWGEAFLIPFRVGSAMLGLQPGKPFTDLAPEEEEGRRRFLNERLPPPGGERQRDRLATIRAIIALLERILAIGAAAGALALLLSMLRPRRALRTPWCWVAAAALAAIVARTFLVGYINTYWWHGADDYLTAVGPLVAVFPVLGLAALIDTLGLANGRAGARTRDGLALAALSAVVVLVVGGVAEHRSKVAWPLSCEQLTALRQPGSRAVVTICNLEVEMRSRGLGLTPGAGPAYVVTQVRGEDRVFCDAVIELRLPDLGGAHWLRVRWASTPWIFWRSSWRDILVPTGQLVSLRLPLDERGVSHFLMEGLPPDAETEIVTLGFAAARRMLNAPTAAPSVRSWIHRQAPRQLVCEIRGAPVDAPVLVQFASRRRATPQGAAEVVGALEIDLDAPLDNGAGGRLELRMIPDDTGFATRTWVVPESVALPEGPIFVQAALPGRLLPSSPVEPLMMSQPAELDLPAPARGR